jgi:ribosome biogenesis protein MAK21
MPMPRTEDEDEDEDIGNSVGDSELDEHASSDTDEDHGGLSESAYDNYPDGRFDFGLSSAEASDMDDLVRLDAEDPVNLTKHGKAASAAQESSTFGGGKKRKRKGSWKEDSWIRKKKIRALPTFASYEDFVEMIEDGPEENV